MPTSAAASIDDNQAKKELARRFFAEQDRLKGGPAEELCASDYTAVLGSGPAMDRAGHEAFSRAFYTAFPDARHAIEDVLLDDDAVVVRFVLRGTHLGSFFGIPKTERTMAVPAHVILRVRDGKVRKLLGIFDEAGLLRQIGVLPSG
jgi:predicted ester cyclase